VRRWDTKPRLLADVSLALTTLGYRPRTGIETGIERTATWFDTRWPEICTAARFSS
jgi:nucleoside-diphosphate-sugar epimerase